MAGTDQRTVQPFDRSAEGPLGVVLGQAEQVVDQMPVPHVERVAESIRVIAQPGERIGHRSWLTVHTCTVRTRITTVTNGRLADTRLAQDGAELGASGPAADQILHSGPH